jgi:hypothetical protein
VFDGEGAATTIPDYSDVNTSAPFIGAQDPTWENFDGFLDELSIWSRAISEEEIQNYYGNALSGFEQGLVAHYGFNDGAGTSLTDLTGNGNDGTINGATWADGAPLAAPVPPDPEIRAVNISVNENSASLSIDAVGDFSHYHWRLDWDGEVMSTESTTMSDLWYGLHYVRVKLVNADHEAITDEFVQSFYVTNGSERSHRQHQSIRMRSFHLHLC